jgi:hypothetical protein
LEMRRASQSLNRSHTVVLAMLMTVHPTHR